jgi:hypothetical protein
VYPESAFQSHIEGGLETFGIEADETERAVMMGVLRVWQPGLERLLAADLDAVEPEPEPDLSKPPG